MTLMAVDLDKAGKPKKWMVENSWGSASGYRGHLIMTDKWFDEYMFRVVAEKKYVPCGLSFLETSCNPYILSMGTEETATRRLNLAQSFNPMGSLLGMYVAMQFIQAKLHPMCTEDRALLNDSEFQAIKESDLSVLIAPYLIIGLIIVAMFV